MAGLREALLRFRPVGAPGAPTSGAVPADRAGEQAAELAPVFALLDEAEAEARAVRSQGDADAAAIREEAARRAESIIRDARGRAPAERERAAGAARAQAEADSAALLREAHARAESLRARAGPRVHEYVEQFVARTAQQLMTPPPAPDRVAGEPGASR